MEEEQKNIGTISAPGFRNPTGIGYIYLPSNIDRESYLKNCYRTNTVTIITENREILHKIPIDKNSIQSVIFPKNREELGSPVAWISHPFKKIPIIVAIYDFIDEYSQLTENSFKLNRNDENSNIQIYGDAKKGLLRILVEGDKKDLGELVIDVSNKENTGKIGINLKGNFRLNVSKGNVDINVNEGDINFETSQIFNILAEKINLGGTESKEALVLGNKLSTLLKDLIQEISISTTAAGGLLNAAKIVAFKKQVDSILSKLGYIKE